jgi:hypothetical protein
MTEETLNHEEVNDKIHEAVKQFEEDFDCHLDYTGATMDDHPVYGEEYFITGLIEAPDCLDFEVGGWIEFDDRSNTIQARIGIKLNQEMVELNRYLRTTYTEAGGWEKITYEQM